MRSDCRYFIVPLGWWGPVKRQPKPFQAIHNVTQTPALSAPYRCLQSEHQCCPQRCGPHPIKMAVEHCQCASSCGWWGKSKFWGHTLVFFLQRLGQLLTQCQWRWRAMDLFCNDPPFLITLATALFHSFDEQSDNWLLNVWGTTTTADKGFGGLVRQTNWTCAFNRCMANWQGYQ